MSKFNKKIAWLIVPFTFWDCCSAHAVNANDDLRKDKVLTQTAQKDITKALEKVTQYEIDAYFLINQCIDNLSNDLEPVKSNLLAMVGECNGYIAELSALINKYGGKVPAYSKDFKGFFMEGYASMRRITEKGPVEALQTNLKLIFKGQESVLKTNLPEDVKVAIQKTVDYKRKAINSFENSLKNK